MKGVKGMIDLHLACKRIVGLSLQDVHLVHFVPLKDDSYGIVFKADSGLFYNTVSRKALTHYKSIRFVMDGVQDKAEPMNLPQLFMTILSDMEDGVYLSAPGFTVRKKSFGVLVLTNIAGQDWSNYLTVEEAVLGMQGVYPLHLWEVRFSESID